MNEESAAKKQLHVLTEIHENLFLAIVLLPITAGLNLVLYGQNAGHLNMSCLSSKVFKLTIPMY